MGKLYSVYVMGDVSFELVTYNASEFVANYYREYHPDYAVVEQPGILSIEC